MEHIKKWNDQIKEVDKKWICPFAPYKTPLHEAVEIFNPKTISSAVHIVILTTENPDEKRELNSYWNPALQLYDYPHPIISDPFKAIRKNCMV
jgi:hypothetical protein